MAVTIASEGQEMGRLQVRLIELELVNLDSPELTHSRHTFKSSNDIQYSQLAWNVCT